MLENIYSRWELLTNGIGYQNQSEQHKARRASSEDSCKPNSKTKIGRKQGREQFWYQRKVKKSNDRWKATMTLRRWIPVLWWSTTMEPGRVRHPSTWRTGLIATCIMNLLTPEVKVLGCGSAAHQAPQHQRCRCSLLLHLKLSTDFICQNPGLGNTILDCPIGGRVQAAQCMSGPCVYIVVCRVRGHGKFMFRASLKSCTYSQKSWEHYCQ